MESIFENIYVNRDLQADLFSSVCSKYGLTRTELLVLLFLGKNTRNTATDIVDKLKIAKSHVSASVRDLEERGYVKSKYEGNNHRTVHLQLCDNTAEIIKAGEDVQDEFISIICKGFSPEERHTLKEYIQRMTANANAYLKDKNCRRRIDYGAEKKPDTTVE